MHKYVLLHCPVSSSKTKKHFFFHDRRLFCSLFIISNYSIRFLVFCLLKLVIEILGAHQIISYHVHDMSLKVASVFSFIVAFLFCIYGCLHDLIARILPPLLPIVRVKGFLSCIFKLFYTFYVLFF